ncbi:type II toxin-antitoxin system YafO family toxin [Algicola sagamiensis]|uniref:type II toxin-antitoxin system YafO family toxin n=1 Tax=Algicola sagamiensis TaxID=163869 RepID=UPI00036BB786|nr:type II toxin-antitoxin system YafO family toxin [Algicola sagamiensis]
MRREDLKVFVRREIYDYLSKEQVKELTNAFKEYQVIKANPEKLKEIPDLLGRDVPYEFPSNVFMSGLRHHHIKDDSPSCTRSWAASKRTIERSKDPSLEAVMMSRVSDTALVYCRGYSDPNAFLFIGVYKGAHALYKKHTFLGQLADIADDFRGKF